MATAGETIKILREAARIDGTALAERVGIDNTALSHIEAGRRQCSAEQFTGLLTAVDEMAREHRAEYEAALASFGLKPARGRRSEPEGAVV